MDKIEYQTTAAAGSLNLTTTSNIYYFGATEAIAYTYNLPAITCDGTEFKIYRFDTLNAASLTINSTNNIIYQGTSSTSLSVDVYTAVFLVSFNSNWYVKRIGRQGYQIQTVLFSESLRTTTSAFTTYSTGSGQVISRFSYPGNTGMLQLMTGGRFICNSSFLGVITINLFNSSGNLIATSGSGILTNTINIVPLGTINYSNLPNTSDYLTISINVNIGSVRIYSYTIY